MSKINLNDLQDGILVFNQSGKLEFFNQYCDEILPGLTEGFNDNSLLEDVYAAINRLGYAVPATTAESEKDPGGWHAFKKTPSDVEFASGDGTFLRWSTRHLGDGEFLATLSNSSVSAKHKLRFEQLAKMFSISEMSGHIGHDLNNFLTIIQGNLELLESFVSNDEKLSRWVTAAGVATDRGSDMAKNLLYLGRRRPANRCEVNVAESISEAVERSRIGDDQISIETLIPSDLNKIRVDEKHFKVVLQNLLTNAVEACGAEGKITVSGENFSDNDNDFGNEEDSSFVRVIIKDNGRGMSRSVLERAFEPYFTTKKNQKGAGFGLSRVFGFARQTDGFVSLESEVGEGTTAILEIPVGASKVTLPQILENNELALLSGNERVMVVDDDTAVRTIAAEMLKYLGYDIVQANDAKNALEQLANGCSVDLVFSDVIMPGGIDGIHMARIIRDKYPNFKILLASGYFDSGRLAGIDEFSYLGKPYDQMTLGQHVRQLLDE